MYKKYIKYYNKNKQHGGEGNNPNDIEIIIDDENKTYQYHIMACNDDIENFDYKFVEYLFNQELKTTENPDLTRFGIKYYKIKKYELPSKKLLKISYQYDLNYPISYTNIRYKNSQILLFGDRHNSFQNQCNSKCGVTTLSKFIDELMNDVVKNDKVKLDLFIEQPYDKTPESYDLDEITDIITLLRKIFEDCASQDKQKCQQIYGNSFRYHYIDIRHYSEIKKIFDSYQSLKNDNIPNSNDINNIRGMIDHIGIIIKSNDKNISKIRSSINKLDDNIQDYLLTNLLHEYNYFKEKIEYLLRQSNITNGLFAHQFANIFIAIMDYYTIARTIYNISENDKQILILYTGNLHTQHMIKILSNIDNMALTFSTYNSDEIDFIKLNTIDNYKVSTTMRCIDFKLNIDL
jgi:hypothetical protein